MTPLLSVCLITYNHEKYLDESLTSIFRQDVSFDLEVVIGEDLSSDRTREIVMDWVERYPHVIRPVFRNSNLGLKKNFIDTLSQCRGDYVAVLSGDDYWTDPLKLQRQVDFLARNPDYTLISTNAAALRNGATDPDRVVNATPTAFDFDTSDLIKGNPCIASQVVFKNNLIQSFPDVYYLATGEDRGLYILLSRLGRCRFDPTVTGVYRIHEASITSRRAERYRGRIDSRQEAICNARAWNVYFQHDFDAEVAMVVHRNSVSLLRLAYHERDVATGAEAVLGIDSDRVASQGRRIAIRALQPLAAAISWLTSAWRCRRSTGTNSSLIEPRASQDY